MSDQPNTESCTLQHTALRDIAFSGIWTHNPSKWAAADPCLTLQGDKDWQGYFLSFY